MKPFRMDITPRKKFQGTMKDIEADVRMAFRYYDINTDMKTESARLSVFYLDEIHPELRDYLEAKYKIRDVIKPDSNPLFPDTIPEGYSDLDFPWDYRGPRGMQGGFP